MCGEHADYSPVKGDVAGSSPHVRGALDIERGGQCFDGIIPACAGSTGNTHTSTQQDRDHPRMCGEHSLRPPPLYPTWGSSPHVRGAPRRFMNLSLFAGIIPACAGSTLSASETSTYAWDHPRMCGEHQSSPRLEQAQPGSSPHVRGALHALFRRMRYQGIIPACAGSTRSGRCSNSQWRDHPRMCGEHFLIREMDAKHTGSSPHVRGAPVLHVARTL